MKYQTQQSLAEWHSYYHFFRISNDTFSWYKTTIYEVVVDPKSATTSFTSTSIVVDKGPFILLYWIISVECQTSFDPSFMLIGCLGLPLFWLDVSSGKFKFVGHSTEIIRQSKIKGPLRYKILAQSNPIYVVLMHCLKI